jgi:tRNA (cmo5U34)-methyltransferase
LGAGTGLFSWHVFQRYRNARFTFVDIADILLELTKLRFTDHEDQFSIVKADYRNLTLNISFDLIISSLSIHYLEDGVKQDLFHRVYSQFNPEGVFINVDQIKAPSEGLRDL